MKSSVELPMSSIYKEPDNEDNEDENHLDIDEIVASKSAPEEVDQESCKLCAQSTQHFCRKEKCGKPICQMGCSEPDLNSTNEMHRVHMKGDKRCGETNIEKPDLEDKGKKSSSEDDMGTKKKSPSKEDDNESTNPDGFQAPKNAF